MATRNLILLPSENQTREFDAKLLLACVLAERGHRVVVGARHNIHNHIADYAPGIYVAKDFRKPSERILPLIAGLGHHITAWDEEGLVQPQPQLYYNRRYSLKAIAHVQSVFAWGPANHRLLEGAPQWPRIAIHNTGNPRLDLLRPELRGFHQPDVLRLQREHGRFVLFDSNFASFNPAVRSAAPALFEKGAALSPYLEGRKRLFARWQAVLPQLARAIAPVKIIVRPHPAESHDVWNRIAASQNSILVAHEGSALAWILASEAMLHSGCTTGLEAAFMGHRAIAFRPENLTDLQNDLPDSLSTIVDSEATLILAVQKQLQKRASPRLSSGQRDIADDAAYARSGALASDRIADVLVGLAPRGQRSLGAVCKARLRQAEKWLTGLNPHHKTSATINSLRYPGVSAAEVALKIAALQTTLLRFQGVTFKALSPDVYILQA